MILNDLRSICVICYLTVNFEVASHYGTLPQRGISKGYVLKIVAIRENPDNKP